MKTILSLLLALVCLTAAAEPVKKPHKPLLGGKRDRAAMCSGAKHCLFQNIAGCTEDEKKKNKDIKYDADFCGPFLELQERGMNMKSDKAMEIFSYLGKKYRVTYPVKGTLPINAEMMDYLMDHMPFAARMINVYQGTKYTLIYTGNNRRDFKADNGGSLKGRISMAVTDPTKRETAFFGYGTAKVLMWKLYGVALVFLDYHQVNQSTLDYELRSVVFPANAMLNSVMNMGMFKDVVKNKMMEIVGHVENSAHRYAAGDKKPIEKNAEFQKGWVKQDLEAFNEVIRKSNYVPPPKKKK